MHALWALLPVLQERLRVHAPDRPPGVACTQNKSTSVPALQMDHCSLWKHEPHFLALSSSLN